MMTDLPDPLTPADCDLRGLEYMPLLGQHLFGSEFNARANDTEWRAALTLWWAAWTQQPAASLPNDDTALCRLADLGRDLKTWKKIKSMALYGFVECSDGRLYHPTIAKQALLAWDKRVKERQRKADWRAKRQGQEQSRDADVPRDTGALERGQGPGRDADVPADGKQRDGTGRDDKEKKTPLPPSAKPKNGYAFEGRTIRLNPDDFDRWRAAYHAVPDLAAELQALDDWLQGPRSSDAKRKDWFQVVSRSLGRKHEERVAAKRDEDAARADFERRYPPQCLPESEWRALMGDEEFERKRGSLLIAEAAPATAGLGE